MRCRFRSDDGTLADDMLLKEWGPMFLRCAEQTGKKLDTEEKMKGRIEAAGFVNVHERMYKVPVGDWAKNPMLKEAGRFQKMQFLVGMEGVSSCGSLPPNDLYANYGHSTRSISSLSMESHTPGLRRRCRCISPR